MIIISEISRVGEVAAAFPGATRVFEAAGIDYCCGGGRTLKDACVAVGAPLSGVLRALQNFEQARTGGESRDWRSADLSELITHIIDKHHVFTRLEMERLDKLLTKVCSVHGANHSELAGIADLFRDLHAELLSHMQKEEAVLFPYINDVQQALHNMSPVSRPFFGTVRNPVRMMMQEHDHAGDILIRIRSLSADFKVPEGACISYKTLYEALAELERDLHQHIHLENNILFPRATEMEEAAAAGSAAR